jgi:4-amino-4-deoxy-L-arabinose transferase-like glycosyltransferase
LASVVLSQRQKLALLLIVVVFLTATVSVALTRIPWCDEAWFACAGFNLAAHGRLTTPVVAPAPDDPKTMGLAQHTYWVMPLNLLFQAGWYKLFGFNLFALRSVSILWGLIGLLSWFWIMQMLAGDVRIAVLTVGLLGTDYVFILRAADGRMDMMSAALGYAALAAYLVLRNRSLNLAVLCAHSLVVLSGLTHPNGGLLSLAGVVFLTWYYDRESIRWRHTWLAAIPYLVGAAGWSLYILEDPRLFLTQFGGNASGRLGLLNPWRALRREIVERYLPTFGFQPGSPAAAKIKLLLLLGYVAGMAGTLSVPELRRRRGVRALFILCMIHLLFLTMQSVKHPAYLVYSIPFFSAFLAVWMLWCWSRPALPSVTMGLALAVFILLQLGAVANVVSHNKYGGSYGETAAFLKSHAGAADPVVGEPELGFALGFDTAFLDDRRLGYYSHRMPRFIVMGEDYRQSLQQFRRDQPEIAQYITGVLASQYRPVFKNDTYTVFARQ